MILTPSHVLDDAGTSGLLNLANKNAADALECAIDVGSWVFSAEHDLAGVVVPAPSVSPWAVWPLLERPVWTPEFDGTAITVSLPRSREGGVALPTTFEARVAEEVTIDWPSGEFALDHTPEAGASGSPVFGSSDQGLVLLGLLTSAIQGDGEPQCSALRSDYILDFVAGSF